MLARFFSSHANELLIVRFVLILLNQVLQGAILIATSRIS